MIFNGLQYYYDNRFLPFTWVLAETYYSIEEFADELNSTVRIFLELFLALAP